MKRGVAGAGAAAVGCAFSCVVAVTGVVDGLENEVSCAVVRVSGGSEDGGSEPMLGLTGVRKGDLNGFFKVVEASFSLRRLACGVDIVIYTAAFGEM